MWDTWPWMLPSSATKQLLCSTVRYLWLKSGVSGRWYGEEDLQGMGLPQGCHNSVHHGGPAPHKQRHPTLHQPKHMGRDLERLGLHCMEEDSPHLDLFHSLTDVILAPQEGGHHHFASCVLLRHRERCLSRGCALDRLDLVLGPAVLLLEADASVCSPVPRLAQH